MCHQEATFGAGSADHTLAQGMDRMEWLRWLFDFIVHANQQIDALIQQFGPWIYAVMFLVIFCETGLVVTPFLPGDSLLFALGTFAAREDGLSLGLLLLLLSIAAVLGDSVNYAIGAALAPRIFSGERIRFLNPHHLEQTHEFFERYGAKAIILARFAPIVRTFAPFVAGMGRMTYAKFMAYNVIGGLTWVWLFLLLGYFVGEKPFFQKNFTAVIFAIVFISIIPPIVEFWRERRRLQRAAVTPESSGETVSPPRGSNPS